MVSQALSHVSIQLQIHQFSRLLKMLTKEKIDFMMVINMLVRVVQTLKQKIESSVAIREILNNASAT